MLINFTKLFQKLFQSEFNTPELAPISIIQIYVL